LQILGKAVVTAIIGATSIEIDIVTSAFFPSDAQPLFFLDPFFLDAWLPGN
jgi:hypothetical protein